MASRFHHVARSALFLFVQPMGEQFKQSLFAKRPVDVKGPHLPPALVVIARHPFSNVYLEFFV